MSTLLVIQAYSKDKNAHLDRLTSILLQVINKLTPKIGSFLMTLSKMTRLY